MSFDPRIFGARCDECPLQGFKPVPPEGPEDAPIVFVGEGPGKIEVARGRPFCLDAETLVLMADLSWKLLGSIVVGDRILTVEEEPSPSGYGVSNRAARQWLIAEVTNVMKRRAETGTIVTSEGNLCGTADHRVLSKRRTREYGKGQGWIRLDQLHAWNGWKAGGRSSTIVSIGRPWSADLSYEGGWLAGLFDGEGYVAGSHGGGGRKARAYAGFAQNEGPIFDRGLELIRKFGFEPVAQGKHTYKGKTCYRVTIGGGFLETVRFLGTFRPIRLIRDFQTVISRRTVGTRNLKLASVLGRYASGERDVVDITTTAGTFIANGFVVHNCGPSGVKLDELLWKVGYRRSEVFVTNSLLCRCETPGEIGKKKFEVKTYIAWLRKENVRRRKAKEEQLHSPFDCCWPRLRRELFTADRHARRRGAPNGVVVVPLGNFALKQLAGVTGIMKYRGSVLQPEASANPLSAQLEEKE